MAEIQARDREYATDRQREADQNRELEEERSRIALAPKPLPMKSLAIKGFYVGMSPREALGLSDMYNLTNRQDRVIDGRYLIGYAGKKIRQIAGSGDLHDADGRLPTRIYGQIVLWFESDELVSLEMTQRTVNGLFNVSDLDPWEFAQQLVDSYGLSGMTPTVTHGIPALGYRDNTNGFEIAIYNGKCLCLRRIPRSIERKFD